MKKIGVFFVCILFLSSPLTASAQSFSPEQKAAIIAQLIQLVQQLEAQIAQIIAQQQQVIQQNNQIVTQNQQIVQNTSSTISVPPAPVPQIDKSALIVSLYHTGKIDAIDSIPYGEFEYRFQVLDSNGLPIKLAPVTMNAPDNLYGTTTTQTANSSSDASQTDWHGTFDYTPKKSGDKILTFTSGSMTQQEMISIPD